MKTSIVATLTAGLIAVTACAAGAAEPRPPRLVKDKFYANQVKHTCRGTGLVEVRGINVRWTLKFPKGTRSTESGLKPHRYWVVKAKNADSARASGTRIYGKVTAIASAKEGYVLPEGAQTEWTFNYKKPSC